MAIFDICRLPKGILTAWWTGPQSQWIPIIASMETNENQWCFEAPNHKIVWWPVDCKDFSYFLRKHHPCRICYCHISSCSNLSTRETAKKSIGRLDFSKGWYNLGLYAVYPCLHDAQFSIRGQYTAWLTPGTWQPSIMKTAKKARTPTRAIAGTSGVLSVGRGVDILSVLCAMVLPKPMKLSCVQKVQFT